MSIKSLCFILFFLPLTADPQLQSFHGIWYNMENFFHPKDAPRELIDMGWSSKKYAKKLQRIAQLLISSCPAGEPALIGLCEIGGANILEDLIRKTCLQHQGYGYSLTSGQDARGIQVALLHKLSRFHKIGHTSYPIDMKGQRPTRDILHVWGEVCPQDTLDVLLCHFPSRAGGEQLTEWRRQQAGIRLRLLYDSLKTIRGHDFKLILMGDFNEGKEEKVLLNEVGATPWGKEIAPTHNGKLYLMPYPSGTYKYKGLWTTFDKLLVNAHLLDSSCCLSLKPESVRPLDAPFLFKKDKTWGGVRPRRTFYGHRYERGFSDHLPLLFELRINCSPDATAVPPRPPATSRSLEAP
ncbi:MAG: endonuclease/exonuclease/phosphatase family protein [Tannerellaceae bacterium]|jgi:hypothetical protein|nr:endonuclease/exonuclease/phosphatase family protein [Tannerellaceae bacterium]